MACEAGPKVLQRAKTTRGAGVVAAREDQRGHTARALVSGALAGEAVRAALQALQSVGAYEVPQTALRTSVR